MQTVSRSCSRSLFLIKRIHHETSVRHSDRERIKRMNSNEEKIHRHRTWTWISISAKCGTMNANTTTRESKGERARLYLVICIYKCTCTCIYVGIYGNLVHTADTLVLLLVAAIFFAFLVVVAVAVVIECAWIPNRVFYLPFRYLSYPYMSLVHSFHSCLCFLTVYAVRIFVLLIFSFIRLVSSVVQS